MNEQLRLTGDVTLANGVRARHDGRGDTWAEQHRQLGPTFNMQDLDGFFGQIGFAANSGERLFLEFVPDSYEHRMKVYRKFAVIAFFDRKSTLGYAMSDSNRVSLAFYLWICRSISSFQPVPASFFIVSGKDAPWEMTKLDLITGEPLSSWKLEKMDWRQIWDSAGLVTARNRLRTWVEKGE